MYIEKGLTLLAQPQRLHMFDNIMPDVRQDDPPTDAKGIKILVLFGTRPEVIKLAPVIHELAQRSVRTVIVSSSQHTHLLKPFLRSLDIETDYDLTVMRKDQTPNDVCARIMSRLDLILASEKPDMVIVQGDTATTLAGALAAFNRKIPVGHVEAGLRSGNINSPFPEEMNRRVVSQIASYHFAATEKNRRNLLGEGVASDRIFVTGNPVVDSMQNMLVNLEPGKRVASLIASTDGCKRLLLTTHRRESFGTAMTENLKVIRDFVAKRNDVCLFFPVHPNPNVKNVAADILGDIDRVHLLEPLDYADFLALMRSAWLIVSDSGGVQEEAPSLGKPLLVLRENTERPEAISAGVSRLIGSSPGALRQALDENYSIDTWIRSVKEVANPFGDGRSAARIVRIIEEKLATKTVPVRAVRAR